jgi:radical SAM protein with 4Fe4S-binding SPASM domain
MCFYWQQIDNPDKDEFSLEEIEKISKNFGYLQQFSIGGGEPFLRDDLSQICQIFSRNNRAQMVTVPTNCLLPEKILQVTDDFLQRCPDTFFRLSLSLDGIGQDHDEIRGVKGNFDKFLATYNNLVALKKKYSNFNIDIATVFSSFNQHKIKDIFRYVADNLDADNHLLLVARGNTREKVSKHVSPGVFEEMIKVLLMQKRRKENRPFSQLFRAMYEVNMEIVAATLKQNKFLIPCIAGRKMIVIRQDGEVFPCEILEQSIGNIRDYDYNIRNILDTPEAKSMNKSIKKEKCFCTFECAINSSIPFYPKIYFKLLKKILRQLIFKN